jgi:hypothetical protein
MKLQIGNTLTHEHLSQLQLRRLDPVGSVTKMMVAFVVALLVSFVVFKLWLPITEWGTGPGTLLAGVGVLLLVGAGHEAVQVLSMPDGWEKSIITVGFRVPPIAVTYAGGVSRFRYILTLLTPVMLLSFAPLAVCALVGRAPVLVALVSIVTAGVSVVDYLTVLALLTVVPRGALIQLDSTGAYVPSTTSK